MALNTNIGPERVQVFDLPLGTVQVPGAAISTAAFLIGTSKVGAPVNTATSLTSLEDFVDTFGDADDVGYDAYYAVKGFFDNAGTGNTAIIVNVGSSPGASDFIGNAADKSGLRALDAIDDVGLVMVPGLPLELAYLVHGSLIDYTETVRALWGATLTTSFSLLSIPEEISLANSEDDAATGAKFVSVSGSGPYVITVDDGAAGPVDLSAVTAGMLVRDSGSTYAGVISAVDDGANTITVETDPGVTFGVGDDVLVKLPSAISYKEEVINNPSRTAAWYFNPVVVLDEGASASPGDTKSVDPIGHCAGVIARIDANTSVGGPSHAPAGIRYAGLAGIRGLSLVISEREDAGPLRLAFINRLTSFPGSGNVIFGGYTADSGTSPVYTADEQLIQVMRSLQFIKASLEPGLRGFLWENFTPATQESINDAILSFLRNNAYLFPVGLPESQQFRVISVEPTQDDLDQGLLKVRVQVRPNKAVRFIEISLEFPLPSA